MLSKDAHSHKLYFGLCIDEWEKIVAKLVKEDGLQEVVIGNIIIMLLLYANDVVFFANTLGGVQKLIRKFEEFCMHIKQLYNNLHRLC